MTWSYSEVKAADAAQQPPIADLTQAAETLNAQTITVSNRPFKWRDAKRIARAAPTGDWSRIVARARMTPALPPATPGDAAILAAINAVESNDEDIIDPTDSAAWQALQAGIAALHGIGDLSTATIAALGELTTVIVPKWDPRLDAGHIQTARAQP